MNCQACGMSLNETNTSPVDPTHCVQCKPGGEEAAAETPDVNTAMETPEMDTAETPEMESVEALAEEETATEETSEEM